jgi:hypothetical protein
MLLFAYLTIALVEVQKINSNKRKDNSTGLRLASAQCMNGIVHDESGYDPNPMW